MTGTDLCVNKPQSVPVIFEPPCIYIYIYMSVCVYIYIYIYIFIERANVLSFQSGFVCNVSSSVCVCHYQCLTAYFLSLGNLFY